MNSSKPNRSSVKALECNEELLIREDDIQEFHKRRIEVQKEKTDLPHRRRRSRERGGNLCGGLQRNWNGKPTI